MLCDNLKFDGLDEPLHTLFDELYRVIFYSEEETGFFVSGDRDWPVGSFSEHLSHLEILEFRELALLEVVDGV